MSEVERPVIPVADQTDPAAKPCREAAGGDAESFMRPAAPDDTPADARNNAHAQGMTGDHAVTPAAAGATGQEGEPTLEIRAVCSASPADSTAREQPDGGEQPEGAVAEPAAGGARGIRSDTEAEWNDTGRTGFVEAHPAGDAETPAVQEDGVEAHARTGEASHAGVSALDAIAEGASDPTDQLCSTVDMLDPPLAGPVPPDRLPAEPEASAQRTAEPDEAALRLAEAMVFSSAAPVPLRALGQVLPASMDAEAVVDALRARYAGRGVELVDVGGGVQFRTAPDLAPHLRKVIEIPRRLTRVAMETLAIVAYHQPVTRPEVEQLRGTSLSQQTLDSLLEARLIAPAGRKESPGRPTLWATTPEFLAQFGLKDLLSLPRREDLLLEPPRPAEPDRQDAASEAQEDDPSGGRTVPALTVSSNPASC